MVSFDINKGEFCYLVGRTGEGKSTVLKLIYADAWPSEGYIQFDDANIGALSPKEIPLLRRKMGIVFQDFQLLPEKDVYQNICYALKATSWRNNKRIKEKAHEVLMRVGMSGKGSSFPHQLSGGEQQRVAIARALINDPIVLVADEPTGNLDPEATAYIMNILQEIHLSGTAVLMATHEYGLIKRYPARVLQLHEGHIKDHAQADDFLRAYQWDDFENGSSEGF